jgi:hypothetical protein
MNTPSKTSIALAASQGALFGSVLGGVVGYLHKPDSKTVAKGAGLGLLVGSATLLLADVIATAIVDGYTGTMKIDANPKTIEINAFAGAPRVPSGGMPSIAGAPPLRLVKVT